MSIPKFGLISSAHDRFFALAKADEYEILKYVQLLYSKNDLLYIVDLTDVKKSDFSDIKDPLKFTLNGAKRLHIEPDIDTYSLSNLILMPANPPSHDHELIREKISLLFDLIKHLIVTYRSLSAIIDKATEQEIQGLTITKQFLQETIGSDPALDSIVDRDIQEVGVRQQMLDREKSRILKILNGLDYEKDNQHIKQDIYKKLGYANQRGPEAHRLRYVMVKACQT